MLVAYGDAACSCCSGGGSRRYDGDDKVLQVFGKLVFLAGRFGVQQLRTKVLPDLCRCPRQWRLWGIVFLLGGVAVKLTSSALGLCSLGGNLIWRARSMMAASLTPCLC
jgi:hypothetical protein